MSDYTNIQHLKTGLIFPSIGHLTDSNSYGMSYDYHWNSWNRGKDMIVLTTKKLDYMQLAAIGLNNDDIAKILLVSTSTVKATLEGIFKKLNALNRTDAVSLAIAHCLFPPDYRTGIVNKYPDAGIIYQQKLLNRDRGKYYFL